MVKHGGGGPPAKPHHPRPGGGQHRPHGGALSLEKFANAKVSSYDKREKMQRQRELKVRKFSKYQKLKKKLEKQGLLSSQPVKDSVREVEELDGLVPPAAAGGNVEVPINYRSRGSQQQAVARQTQHADAGEHGGLERQQNKRRRSGQTGEAEDHQDRPRQQQQQQKEPVHQQQHRRPAAGEETGLAADQAGEEGDEGEEGGHAGGKHTRQEERRGKRPHHKAPSSIQRLAQQVQAKKDEERAAKEQAAKARAERQAKIEEAERARKHQKALFMKKTKRGQPVMKHRMDKILAALQKAA